MLTKTYHAIVPVPIYKLDVNVILVTDAEIKGEQLVDLIVQKALQELHDEMIQVTDVDRDIGRNKITINEVTDSLTSIEYYSDLMY